MSITIQHTKEYLCRAHLQALAGSAGLNLILERGHDYGVDGTFRTVVRRPDGRRTEDGFSVDFQAKASVSWLLRDGSIVYDLEAKNYNDMASRHTAAVSLILILLCLPRERPLWHYTSTAETVLMSGCYWFRLESEELTSLGRKRIRIPAANHLTPDALAALMEADRLERVAATHV